MQRVKKVTAGVAALAALAFGGAQIAGATGGSSSSDNDGGDAALTGSAADQAKAAAVKAVGGGQATTVRSENDGSAVYEVEVDNAGKTIEVTLDKGFNVIDQKADAQDGPEGDGDGEHADGPDGAITGAKADRAQAAAVQAVGGGSATSVESSDETGGTYEVKVDKAGKVHEVTLDNAFEVTKQQLDDDQSGDQGDGDGETNDD
jgi:uncharacterized membrane protein YkoI